jgi:hypothetical protein
MMWIYWEIKEKHGNFNDASKEVGLEINVEKTKYMLLSRHQNIGRNLDINITNRSFGNFFTVQIFGEHSNNSKLDSEEN